MDVEREHDQTYQAAEVQRVANGLDPRGRGLGMWAFVAHRITGIGLVVYLLLHLLVLSVLAQGPHGWDSFVALARTPVFLVLDVVLIAGTLIHGLNGVRVALTGMGFGLRHQRPALVALTIVAAIALVYAAHRIFTS
jgi:succinate dehydrogenase / fumarate reductase cytochrome b subunit